MAAAQQRVLTSVHGDNTPRRWLLLRRRSLRSFRSTAHSVLLPLRELPPRGGLAGCRLGHLRSQRFSRDARRARRVPFLGAGDARVLRRLWLLPHLPPRGPFRRDRRDARHARGGRAARPADARVGRGQASLGADRGRPAAIPRVGGRRRERHAPLTAWPNGYAPTGRTSPGRAVPSAATQAPPGSTETPRCRSRSAAAAG